MSYDPQDAAMDEFYDQISKDLYPEHKEQAIEEFTEEKLKSYYQQNPDVMRPAVDATQEGDWQLEQKRYSPALVFYVTAIELLLKATLLRPVLYGLIHNEGLAEIMTNYLLSQTGVERYENLLAQLFNHLANIDVKQITREGARDTLFVECRKLQKIRNNIIHKGDFCTETDAEKGKLVSVAVFEEIARPLLFSIGLTVVDNGRIVEVPRH